MRSRTSAQLAVAPLAMICASFFLPSCADQFQPPTSFAQHVGESFASTEQLLGGLQFAWPHLVAFALGVALCVAIASGGRGLAAARAIGFVSLLGAGQEALGLRVHGAARVSPVAVVTALCATGFWIWSFQTTGWPAWCRLVLAHAVGAAGAFVTTILFFTVLSDTQFRLPGALVFVLGLAGAFVLGAIGAPAPRDHASG